MNAFRRKAEIQQRGVLDVEAADMRRVVGRLRVDYAKREQQELKKFFGKIVYVEKYDFKKERARKR